MAEQNYLVINFAPLFAPPNLDCPLLKNSEVEYLGRRTRSCRMAISRQEEGVSEWFKSLRWQQDGSLVSEWDEAFHCELVVAAGNKEMARIHREVTEKIRIIRRLDFTQRPRVEATYAEHAAILNAILHRRCEVACQLLRAHIEMSKAEVRKITLHMLHSARQRSLMKMVT